MPLLQFQIFKSIQANAKEIFSFLHRLQYRKLPYAVLRRERGDFFIKCNGRGYCTGNVDTGKAVCIADWDGGVRRLEHTR